jgi:hypothetical protein
MYCLSDQQIDYILNDISARGVEMESLQQNLLDHVCCIIEQNLDEKGDFESFYQKTIKTFYKDALWEIEEETIFLLTFKNYYKMKKIMIFSGIFSAVTMSLGIFFKFMHWPGASMLLLCGIVISSLVFLPLLFTFKAREKKSIKEKVIVGLGTLSGILMSLSILFKIMHWPGALALGIVSVLVLLFVFLPIYFFTGIRQEDQKVNTITVSILVIMVSGLWLTLIRSPRSTRMIDVRDTNSFIISEQIVETEQKQVEKYIVADTVQSAPLLLSRKITTLCQELKTYIIESETGHKKIESDFEAKSVLLKEQSGFNPFADTSALARVSGLIQMIEEYNALIGAKNKPELKKIPTRSFFVEYIEQGEMGALSLMTVLNQLSQMQMFVLQNERELLVSK